MDYKKLHKDTINRLQQMVSCGKITVEVARGICADFIPESEDERIRKALIKGISKTRQNTPFLDTNVTREKAIAWLEKQGEHANFRNKIQIGDKVTRNEDGVLVNLSQLNRVAKKDEKQGEQKPADKVEPKFKVKYAGSEYNVFETKDIAGVTFYGIEDEPNHIDYVKADNCEIISGYGIKENGSPYPTKPAKFSEQKPAEEYNITGISSKKAQGKLGEMINNLKSVNDTLKDK